MSDCTQPLPLLGNPNIRNRGAAHWASENLVAFGCGRDVIVIDSKSFQLVQVCSSQSGDVTHVYWLPYARSFTNETAVSHKDLISADNNGEIVVWNAVSGEIIHRFIHPENNNRTLIDIQLGEGVDNWRRSKVYILYTGHYLVVFDYLTCTYQNIDIHIAVGPEFSLIPVGFFRFCVESETANPTLNRLAFISRIDVSASSLPANINSSDLLLTYCESWDYQKDPRIVLRKQVILQTNLRTNSAGGGGTGFLAYSNSMQNLSPPAHQNSSDTPEKIRASSIRRLVSDIIVGSDISSSSNNYIPVQATLCFHRGIQDTVLVSTESSIFLVSVHFMTVLQTFYLDKSVAPIIQTIPSIKKPSIVTIHENGAVYLRKYVIVGTHIYFMELETVCLGDSPRFAGKRPDVVSCLLHPFEEKLLVIYFSDGRFLQYGFVNGEIERAPEFRVDLHMNTPSTPFVAGLTAEADSSVVSQEGISGVASLGSEKLLITKQRWVSPNSHLKSILQTETDTIKLKLKRMTPSFGQSCILKSDGNTLLLGTNTGYLLVLEIVEGRVKFLKKLAVHSSCAVSGIEYISKERILTYANANLSTNPRCEFITVNLKTGACTTLKSEAKHHIQCISISPLRQFFVIVYQNGTAPCELWDLSRMQQIKTLPSKLPPITCVQWKEEDKNEVQSTREEVFYLTDFGTFLFTFRVEGSRFAAATCVKLDATTAITGIPISLFTRGKLVFRVDSNGTMVIYNTEKKTASPGFQLGKGPIIAVIAFGAANFLAQFTDSVELWDFQSLKKIRTLLHGKVSTSAITVMKNLMIYITPGSNAVRFLVMDGDDELSKRHPFIYGEQYARFLSPKAKCGQIYAFCKNASSKLSDLIILCKQIGTSDEIKLWSLLSQKLSSNTNRNKSNEDGLLQDMGLLSNSSDFKETIVKISQCVWTTHTNKREDVGRLLLLCGETDRAAEILLDTEPSNQAYVFNGLKASIAVASANLPEQSKAVLKIIATNLIACGDMDKGLELLCLLGKYVEACKYIESNNEWGKAILLCKTALPEKNLEETLARYSHYLVSRKCVIQAALVYIFIGKYEKAIEALFGGRFRHLSYLLYQCCLLEEEDLKLSDHVKLAIHLDFARFLFDNGLTDEAIMFCDSLGNAAQDLKNELEILLS